MVQSEIAPSRLEWAPRRYSKVGRRADRGRLASPTPSYFGDDNLLEPQVIGALVSRPVCRKSGGVRASSPGDDR